MANNKFIAGTKTEVKFVDTSKETKKAMEGLAKTALRASGKEIRKILRANIPVRSNRLKNHIATWAFIDYKTGQPTLQVGFYSWQKVRKKGKIPSHASPHWVEYGTGPIGGKHGAHVITPKNAKVLAYNDTVFGKHVNHPGQRAQHVLRDSVQNNIDVIRAAQEQYLAELNKTIEAAEGKIYPGEEDESD